ncbi:hypothetical protein GVAMD_0815 [Gardnerella vaginalis AMD]|nr:hypothetical protein GVAMD_0815 [Gardnerella vaginalis AMD]
MSFTKQGIIPSNILSQQKPLPLSGFLFDIATSSLRWLIVID